MKASLALAIAFLVNGSFLQARVQDSMEEVGTLNTVNSIRQSIGWYQQEYGRTPPNDPTVLISVLQGHDIEGANPKKLAFWEPRREKRRLWWRVHWGSFNDRGELIDGWGTPLRWLIEQHSWTLISAGKNRKHEDGKGDDLKVEILKLHRTSASSESPLPNESAAGARGTTASGDQ